MPATDVVADANVALKWFHDAGEEGVAASLALLDSHRAGDTVVHVLDLTFYEVGNALLRGRAKATADQVSTVITALREICPAIAPDAEDLALAATLAADHDLTLYDAAYAAVARRREARLISFDRRLLDAGLAEPPSTEG